jgi:hypothetical protein
MKISYKKPANNNELWLEFGRVNPDGWHDLNWYNEGEASEFGYWLKHFIKDLLTPNRYYLIRYMGLSVYLRGGRK